MSSNAIDESLREQSKLLLRKLKEKQSRLQNDLNSSRGENSDSKTPNLNSCDGELQLKTLKEVSAVVHPNRPKAKKTTCETIQEKLDNSLVKSVPAKSAKTGRARLQRKRTQSRDEKNQIILKGQSKTQTENKENLQQDCDEKHLKSKDIEAVEQTETVCKETTEIPGEIDNYRELQDIGTPKSSRRRIIDKNIRVTSGADLNVSELMREVEDEYPRLNYSYSNVEDTDLKFLQERFAAEEEGTSTDTRVPSRGEDMGVKEKYSDNLENPGNSRKFARYIRDSKKPKSILLSTSQRSNKSLGNSSRVSFRSPTRDSTGNLTHQMSAETRQNHRMLGYDWIAALLENDPDGINQSETFFEELKDFRKVNLEECVNDMYMTGPQELWEHPEREPLPVQKALEETRDVKKTESEVKPYMVNDRLFPEPIQRSLFDGYDHKEPKLQQKEKEGTYEEPRFVRVSIPRSTLMSPHRVKPHRRNSFESADSMALSEHCLKGCNTSIPSTMPAASNIGLRNATLGIKPTLKTTLHDAETLAANYPYEWDPKEQSICRPLPRPSYRPESTYMDSSWQVNVRGGDTSSFNNSSANLKKATDDLLNSTYSLMYEMQRLKTQRSDDPIRV